MPLYRVALGWIDGWTYEKHIVEASDPEEACELACGDAGEGEEQYRCLEPGPTFVERIEGLDELEMPGSPLSVPIRYQEEVPGGRDDGRLVAVEQALTRAWREAETVLSAETISSIRHALDTLQALRQR